MGARVAVFNNRGLGGVPLKVSLVYILDHNYNLCCLFDVIITIILFPDTPFVLRRECRGSHRSYCTY